MDGSRILLSEIHPNSLEIFSVNLLPDFCSKYLLLLGDNDILNPFDPFTLVASIFMLNFVT